MVRLNPFERFVRMFGASVRGQVWSWPDRWQKLSPDTDWFDDPKTIAVRPCSSVVGVFFVGVGRYRRGPRRYVDSNSCQET